MAAQSLPDPAVVLLLSRRMGTEESQWGEDAHNMTAQSLPDLAVVLELAQNMGKRESE